MEALTTYERETSQEPPKGYSKRSARYWVAISTWSLLSLCMGLFMCLSYIRVAVMAATGTKLLHDVSIITECKMWTNT